MRIIRADLHTIDGKRLEIELAGDNKSIDAVFHILNKAGVCCDIFEGGAKVSHYRDDIYKHESAVSRWKDATLKQVILYENVDNEKIGDKEFRDFVRTVVK